MQSTRGSLLWQNQEPTPVTNQPAEPITDTPPTPSPTNGWVTLLEQAYQVENTQSHPKGDYVKVNQALSTLAVIYEKIRNAVDFRAEHLFQKNAIKRILRRRFQLNESSGVSSLALVKELIWGAYFPNDSIPQDTLQEIKLILEKYALLRAKTTHIPGAHEWLLDLVATEIEETLTNPRIAQAWVQAIFLWLTHRYSWSDSIPDEEKTMLWLVAVNRAFLKSDEATLRYQLWLKLYPTWKQQQALGMDTVASQFPMVKTKIDELIHHPLGHRLFRLVRRQVPALWILKDIWSHNPKIPSQDLLYAKVQEECQKKYFLIGKKVRQGIIRSIIYILATKSILAILIELPYEQLTGHTSLVPLLINLLFPPLLMFVVGLMIKIPNAENTLRIYKKILNFQSPVSASDPRQTITLQTSKLGRGLSVKIFTLFYLVFFIASFGLVSLFLIQMHFTWLSIIVFFFFVCLVLLFGFRVRWAANELLVIEEKDSLLSSFINLLSLPFIDVGVKLSHGLARFNFLTLILDFLVEAPLKLVLDVISDFTGFIRKKREEFIEVPL